MASTKKNKFNLKPTPGHIVIKPLEAQTKTSSGIYLPETAGEKPQKGEVVAVGEEEINEKGAKIKCPVKVGDTVIYKKWGGSEVRIDETDYLFSKYEDILAVLE